MDGFGRVLREAMAEAGTSQSDLARVTGVAQGRISEYVNGRVGMSAEMLQYLLSGLGLRAVVAARAEAPAMSRSDKRSWLVHRAVAERLSPSAWPEAAAIVRRNIARLEASVHGEPHLANLARWRELAAAGDVRAIRRVLLDPGDDGRAMRDVSPFAGVLPEPDRLNALAQMGGRP
ncbi:MAG: helix-turn-helix domain-containing protein [Bifidobacteriaceae bacterium]|nr:helix-turn-helix domain-containing protein [Bifidobacteriaceae bacterium]